MSILLVISTFLADVIGSYLVHWLSVISIITTKETHRPLFGAILEK